MAVAIRDGPPEPSPPLTTRSQRGYAGLGRPSDARGGAGIAASTRAAASARQTPPARGVWDGQPEPRKHSAQPFVCSPKAVSNVRSHLRTSVLPVKRMGYSAQLKTVLGADLAPQRPRYVRERGELPSHILEPE